ncbi:polyprenyl synthetase family protein [Candidatus Saccharibacteria bacterium]|nr:MAG: polyprenyl synthetase family protein [Candidatus Saccharibacteria bacterium]
MAEPPHNLSNSPGFPSQRPYHFPVLMETCQTISDDLTSWTNQHLPKITASIVTDTATLQAPDYRPEKRSRMDEVIYFSLLNRGTDDARTASNTIRKSATAHEILRLVQNSKKIRNDQDELPPFLADIVSDARQVPEVGWLEERLKYLHSILPRETVEQGAMGKVARTILGVLSITAMHPAIVSKVERKTAVLAAIPGAYYYAATYPIVDDVLHDSSIIPARLAERAHSSIVNGLSDGQDISLRDIPDHPLAEELLSVYDGLRSHYPFETNQHLYDALLSMYTAQHLEATGDHLDKMYPLIAMKAGLSRVVAHLLSNYAPIHDDITRLLYSLTRNQLLDDFRDYFDDNAAGRLTPFTTYQKGTEQLNPLLVYFASNPYIAQRCYNGSPRVEQILGRYGSLELARSLLGQPDRIAAMENTFGDDGPLSAWLATVGQLPCDPPTKRRLTRNEKIILDDVTKRLSTRSLQNTDPRTYFLDNSNYIENLILQEFVGNNAIHETVRYALRGESKRVRSMLGLMLADSLGIDHKKVEPCLVGVEMAHTSSLLFDDLPAQDNAKTRRGKPAAHHVFPESQVQLAGIALIDSVYLKLTQLKEHYPPEKVLETIAYIAGKIGKDLCEGQNIDLTPSSATTTEEIIRMYALKTSSLIDASLVPLMMLEQRPPVEIELMQTYAYHAGIVFQIQDDILDATGSASILGKDSQQDNEKSTVVTLGDVTKAQFLRDYHLDAAIKALDELPFSTGLLASTVRYFANRRR